MSSPLASEAQTPFSLARLVRGGAVTLLAVTLIWTPFPLGGAVGWGAAATAMLTGAACLLAVLSQPPRLLLADLRHVAVPALLALAVMAWIAVQMWSGVPDGWKNPVWNMTAQLLHQPVAGTISINPWRTAGELLKLATAAAAFWAAFTLSRDTATARLLLGLVIGAATLYAVYGFLLYLLGTQQVWLIYGMGAPRPYVSGPFMLHNSFATYCGLALVGALVRLFEEARPYLDISRGPRLFALNLMQFLFGQGAAGLIAVMVLFAAVVGSRSRAGFAATAIALAVIWLVAIWRAARVPSRLWATVTLILVVIPLGLFLTATDTSLGNRYAELLDAGNADDVRLLLWRAARAMIAVFPWTGLGLGTFQDAYPLFAHKAMGFVMDKAHNDYLEFAAGAGLPAACAWWLAMAWLCWLCLKGALTRRRHAVFAITGFSATILVAAHSAVDFSLQIPAVAVSYAVLLGIGVAQSRRSAESGSRKSVKRFSVRNRDNKKVEAVS